MRESIKVQKSHPTIKVLLAATFPEYKGRKVSVCMTDQPVCCSINWDGGSRDDVRGVRLFDGAVTGIPHVAPWDELSTGLLRNGIQLPEGTALIVHSIFCGKDAGITIYVAPATAKRLPAGTLPEWLGSAGHGRQGAIMLVNRRVIPPGEI